MLIIIAVLLAIVVVMILIMLSSVYQMDRDYKSRLTKLTQNYMSLKHKLEALESIVNRMREIPQEDDDE